MQHKGEAPGTGVVVLPPAPYACQEPISATQVVNDRNLGYLNRNRMLTTILYDRVAGLACLGMFNQLAPSGEPDLSSFGHFLQAYYELHVANYTNPGTEPCRQLLRDNALLSSGRGQVLMGALRYRFDYVDSNAVRDGRLIRPTPGGPLYVGPNTGYYGSATPFLQREVVVGAALVDTLQTGSASFVLDEGYVFSNTGVALTSASIDFDNGQAAQTFFPGQGTTIAYPSVGEKLLTFTFTYADGQQYVARSGLYVKRAVCVSANCRTTAEEPRVCFAAPLAASRAFQGAFGKADISYYYSTTPLKICNGTQRNVTKPIIVVDGFDHNNERNAAKLYNTGLAYTEGGQATNFGEDLRALGYDVVVMDMPNVPGTPVRVGTFLYTPIERRSGSDYIERNGLTLVSLIEELNRQTAAAGSTEEIVIVGPSMGGQIARYALAYMEANNIPHRTRLYIALDSPHNGANVPIGLQRFVRHYADDTKDTKLLGALDAIDAPASREMTAQHYNFDNTNAAATAFAPHPERTAFMATLNALRPGGFPANVRRVAVTNGALNGTAQRDQNNRPITDGDQAFLLQQQGVPASSFAGVVVRVLFPIGLLARPITTASGRVNFSPGQGNTSRIVRTFKLFQGETLYDATGPAGSCGLDASPGGWSKFFGEVADGNSNAGLFQGRNFFSVRDRASFIPMLSALGCTTPGYNNCSGVDARLLVCNNGTPFDACYGPTGVNEEHTQLTAGNAAFLRAEILRQTPRPVLARAAPASLCVNGPLVTLAVVPECLLPGRSQYAMTYTWTVSSGLVITSGSVVTNGPSTGGYTKTGASVQIAAINALNTYPTVRVTATRNGYAPSTATMMTVRVVTTSSLTLNYTAPNSYLQNDVVPANEWVSFGIGTANGCDLSTATWKVNGVDYPQSASSGPTAGRSAIFVNVGSGATCTVEITADDMCSNARISASKTVRTGTGPNFNNNRSATPGPTLETYPNPVQGIVRISVEAAVGSTLAATSPADVRLFDPYGHLVRRTQGSGSRYLLDTHGLPVGMYNLVVVRGGQVLRKHIEVSN